MTQHSLEEALGRTENDAEQTSKAADALVSSVRRFRNAAKTGNLRDLRNAMEAGERALVNLRQLFANMKEGWQFDEAAYMDSGDFVRELIEAGRRAGLTIQQRDERLYSYPSLIRVSSNDRAVYIDRRREARVRPSVLVSRLRELQRKSPRFRPEAFLGAVYTCYVKLVAMQPRWDLQDGPVVPLVDIYELLTLLPGQTRDYSRQEFARDVYLLHRSGVETARNGARVTFPISRGVAGRTLSIIDESGEEKRYYGIAFAPPRGQ